MSKKRVAVLIDGAYLTKRYQKRFRLRPEVEDVKNFVSVCVNKRAEEVFRVYYYDGRPLAHALTHPLTHKPVSYEDSPFTRAQLRFQNRLAKERYFAFREGYTSALSWKLKTEVFEELLHTPRALTPDDITPDFKQKQVDIKIGLDIAWLGLKKVVDRIILVGGDADFAPALRFAREEGVQVVVVNLVGEYFSDHLKNDSDEIRVIELPPPIRWGPQTDVDLKFRGDGERKRRGKRDNEETYEKQ